MKITHVPHFQSIIPVQMSYTRYNTDAPTLYLWSFLTENLMFFRLYENSRTKIVFIKCTYKNNITGNVLGTLEFNFWNPCLFIFLKQIYGDT